MFDIKKLPFSSSKNIFSMLLLGILFFTSLFFISGNKVNADALNINNINDSIPVYDSDGDQVTGTRNYHIRVFVPGKPNNLYYFQNHYRGAYDWVFTGIGTPAGYKYTVVANKVYEDAYNPFLDVTDNGYLKTYKPDVWYTKGGVYEGGKSGADWWRFTRANEYPHLYAYHMISSRKGVSVKADTSNTSSLVVNTRGEDFLIIFEKA